MKAWRLYRLGGKLCLEDVATPEPRPGSVLIRVQASVLMSYLKAYVDGRLPMYDPPPGPFTIGTNGVGVIEGVGSDVWHLKPGQRVVMSSHFVARENVEEPDQILIGLTSPPRAQPMLADWPDGTLAEFALAPVEAVTPVEGLDDYDAATLSAITRCIVPYGGLLRGQLGAGETLIVNGATGAYGTAAVLVGVAMGAARVIAIGRRREALDALASIAGPRVAAYALSGDMATDAKAIRDLAGNGAQIAFDMVGQAGDPTSTLTALHSLRRGGRLVLMGSMTVDLPVPYTRLMLNGWSIHGQYMYPARAYQQLLDLLRCRLLDLTPLRPSRFAIKDLPAAMTASAEASNLEYVVVEP